MIRAAILSAIALTQSKPAAPPPGPPPPVYDPSGDARLLRWMPSPIRCAGADVDATALRPYGALARGSREPVDQQLRFDIDARGRAVGIAMVETPGPAQPIWQPGREDVVPSLAASDLSAARDKRDCRITYRAQAVPIETAPVADLISYTITPLNGAMPEAGWSRIRGGVDDCIRPPRAEWLTRVMPDWRNVPGKPGARDWVLMGYEMDGDGRPQQVRVVTGTGNADVEAAANEALEKSQLVTDGPRRGCLAPFVRPAGRLLPPEPPEIAALRPAGATCPRQADWETPPRLTFPEPFGRRSIEGWAVIAYDVAPWGQVGNLHVLAAQPAADFGTAALGVLRAAKRKPVNGAGYSGCVDRVYFKMGVSNLD
ncbi:energy transducer TonB [Sphingomonas sp.]|uniref:energy transducer TonB n=1 Tax=Sphingomonas sp. TaxID=28214 RepID=UPI002C5DA503|nr:energy transducer TonB [Sphingomonas sp.]HTG38269.1 energy transducer TonB [Sphingomonas sp.]